MNFPILSAIIFIPLMVIFSFKVQPINIVMVVIVLLYVFIATFSALTAFLIQKKGNPFLISIAFLSMHIAWALGFLTGTLKRNSKSNRK